MVRNIIIAEAESGFKPELRKEGALMEWQWRRMLCEDTGVPESEWLECKDAEPARDPE